MPCTVYVQRKVSTDELTIVQQVEYEAGTAHTVEMTLTREDARTVACDIMALTADDPSQGEPQGV